MSEQLMMELLDVVTVIIAGLMVGNELAIAMFVHPSLDRLPDEIHLPVVRALARLLGKFMPFWYGLVLLLTVAVAILQWHESDRLPSLVATSAFLWLVSVVFSLTANVPINNKIAAVANGAPPADWKPLRKKWDQLHRWRVVTLTIALALLVTGVVA